MNMTSLLGRIATNFEVKQVNNTSVTNFILAVDTTRKIKKEMDMNLHFFLSLFLGKMLKILINIWPKVTQFALLGNYEAGRIKKWNRCNGYRSYS